MDNSQIVIRFFESLDSLKEKGVISGSTAFAEKHGIDRRNLYQLRKTPTRGIFKTWWLTLLVEDYNISAIWLLTGKGDMYEA